MQTIGHSTDSATPSGEFTEGSAAGGVPATRLKAEWLNTIQRELLAILAHAGISVNTDADNQVLQSILKLVGDGASGKADKATTLAGYGITDAFTQTQVNSLLAGKAAKATTLGGYGIADAYTQAQVNSLLAAKADKATTLSGYGISDAYTQAQVNTLLAAKAPLASPALTGIPTAPTAAAGTNTWQVANTAFVQNALAALVDSSPAALDTLKELAAAIGNDPNFATTMLNALADKASKASTLAGYGITDGFRADWSASDYNALSLSGMYQLGSGSTANRPAGWSGSQALHLDYGSYAGTLALSLSDDEIAFRRRSPGGYSAWKSLAFRSSTLSGYGIADAYTKVETLNAIGSGLADYGIGAQKISAEVNLNNYYIPGKYITPQAGLLNLPDGWAQGRHTVDVTGGVAYCVQTIAGAGVNRGRLAIRVYDGTNWVTQELSPLGVGQTWQDFTGSRTWATTYTNTTGRPIQISIATRDPVAGNLGSNLYVSGVKVANFYLSGSSQATVTAIVPPGATYQLTRDDTNDTILLWVELR
ncbi:hypothetical protein [Pseudomonas sp.]|uniref:hypothetical protein n=1 Tax=Pseudomonas sp. TaxID=306 RepID=UPI00289D4DF8|nr:hypothetical protein [Pseudomonas sp.]